MCLRLIYRCGVCVIACLSACFDVRAGLLLAVYACSVC